VELGEYSPVVVDESTQWYGSQVSWYIDHPMCDRATKAHLVPTAHRIFDGNGWVSPRVKNHVAFRHLARSIDAMMDPVTDEISSSLQELPLIDVWVFEHPFMVGMYQIAIVQMVFEGGEFDESIIKHNTLVYLDWCHQAYWDALSKDWNQYCGEMLAKKRKGPLKKEAYDRGVCWYIWIYDAFLFPLPDVPEKYEWVQQMRVAADMIMNLLGSWGSEAPYMAGVFLPLSLLMKHAAFERLLFYTGALWGLPTNWPRWVVLNLFGDWHTAEVQDKRFNTCAPLWWRWPVATFLTHFVVSGRIQLMSDGETELTPVVERGEILITMGDTYVNLLHEAVNGPPSPPVTITFAR